jgi:hypothetical protein
MVAAASFGIAAKVTLGEEREFNQLGIQGLVRADHTPTGRT